MQIYVRGREYAVEQVNYVPSIPYHLVGKRGARYPLCRNIPSPQYLFALFGKETVWFHEYEPGKLIEVL